MEVDRDVLRQKCSRDITCISDGGTQTALQAQIRNGIPQTNTNGADRPQLFQKQQMDLIVMQRNDRLGAVIGRQAVNLDINGIQTTVDRIAECAPCGMRQTVRISVPVPRPR